MIRWAADRPAVVWALGAGLTLAGMVAFTKLPLATRSTVELPKLQISAGWSGASPELMESYLTSPIESAVQAVRGVRKTSSVSQESNSTVTVELDPKVDVTMARLAILERLEALRDALPLAAQGSLSVNNWVPQELRQLPLMEINVIGPFTPGALQKTAEDQVVPILSAIPGISAIKLNGGAHNGIAVSYDPTRLHQLGVDPEALSAALGTAKQVRSLGQARNGAMELSVSTHDQPHTLDDLLRLPVPGPGGRVFTLGDLAVVHPEEDAEGGFYRLNGITAVSLSLQRQSGADAIKTAVLVREALAKLQPTLPSSIRLSIATDSSLDLDKQLKDLMLRGAIAFGAVFLVLLLTLRSVSGSFLVLGSAAIAISTTALALYLLKIPANLLTLAGLAMGIGILVQNGLVVVERLRSASNTAEGRASAGKKISSAVFGSTLTTTVVLLPFLYLQGNARAAFTPFAAAFALALFCSVGTSLVFVPAVGRGGGGKHHRWPRLARIYERIIFRLLRWRPLAIAIYVVALAVLTWGFVKKVPRNNWGSYGFGQDRTTVDASVTFPKGSDPKEIERIVTELERVAVGRPGVALVRSRGDRLSGGVDVEFTTEGGQSDMPWVISDELTERAVLIGGTEQVYVSKPQGQGFSGGSGGSGGSAHRIKILGYSFEGVRQLALTLKANLEKINRVHDVDINAGARYGRDHAVSVALVPDRMALGRVGATSMSYVASVGRQLRDASADATMQFSGEDVPVRVRALGANDRDMAELSEGMVSNPNGAPVRIGDVSTVHEVEELAMIQREDQQYIRVMSYDFRGPQKLSDRTHKAFMASIAPPSGYSVGEDDYQFGQDDSNKGLWTVAGLGLVLVLIAVALVFDSVWAAWMVFLAIPMALGGVVAAFWITGSAFTREAAVGVILVVGLAVNHSILMIDAAVKARRRHGGHITGADALRASTDRVTMIVLVTLTTLASLTPMAWGTSANSLFGAIALATAGGTVAGTLGVMFLLPPLLMLRFRRGTAVAESA